MGLFSGVWKTLPHLPLLAKSQLASSKGGQPELQFVSSKGGREAQPALTSIREKGVLEPSSTGHERMAQTNLGLAVVRQNTGRQQRSTTGDEGGPQRQPHCFVPT